MEATALATQDVVNASDTKKLAYKKYTDRAARKFNRQPALKFNNAALEGSDNRVGAIAHT